MARREGRRILEQLRRLGASCDWDRTQFTMDPAYSKAVLGVFAELFRRGHIYRGKRMVNWCPASLTALSDEEVVMKPVNGTLYKVRYELADSPGQFIQVATTTPRDDPRRRGDRRPSRRPPVFGAGRPQGLAPPQPGRDPVIADAAVDRKFGSGALKITPAHDKVDNEIGLRHGLPVIDILNADATLNELAGPELAGMERFAARKRAVELLGPPARSSARRPTRTTSAIPSGRTCRSSRASPGSGGCAIPGSRRPRRSSATAHPVPSRALGQGLPALARQHPGLVHQPPALVGAPDPGLVPQGARPRPPHRGRPQGPGEGPRLRRGPPDPGNWVQEDDVLDTWASSWLWPFATLGWPDPQEMAKAGFDSFYPTSALVTGPTSSSSGWPA
jgi:valyl-tRNA synthetase